MAVVRYKPDPGKRYRLTDAERSRLDTMTDAEITAAAESDPDNPPLTKDELDRMVDARFVRLTRQATKLSQAQFARAYQINLARLRDLEQGRTRPDSALRAYLTVIAQRPDVVTACLAT